MVMIQALGLNVLSLLGIKKYKESAKLDLNQRQRGRQLA